MYGYEEKSLFAKVFFIAFHTKRKKIKKVVVRAK